MPSCHHCLSTVLAMINSTASLAGNYTSVNSSAAISDFIILKQINVSIHHPTPVNIVEVIWSPPLSGWIKVNTNGASLGSTGQGAYVGVFRDSNGFSSGCFAMNLGIANSLFAEIMGIILAIECACDKGWSRLWIESDSQVAILAFKSCNIIPWQLHN
ncbi:ribonuclease H protein, partial [Trifolium medium]|nr:ribonuclease H protein [Trifolium medium]